MVLVVHAFYIELNTSYICLLCFKIDLNTHVFRMALIVHGFLNRFSDKLTLSLMCSNQLNTGYVFSYGSAVHVFV